MGIGLWISILRKDGEMKSNFGAVNFERRKYPRFSIELPVEYRKLESSRSHPAHTRDVSEGGLLHYISDKIEIGEDLSLKLSFTSGCELKCLQTQVQVVWKDLRFEKDGYCRTGVKFFEL